MSPTGLLVANDLTVSATLDGERVPVINGLSFALQPGKVLGLVGESGAGKSMVGRTVAQLLPQNFVVTSGSLSFGGTDLVTMDGEARRALLGREIAFIAQEPLSALNPVLTIRAQFDEHLARIGVASRDRRDRMLAAFDAVHLQHGADLLGRYSHQLSGGMCQRVLIAIAFASKPKLVIADEPTTALDVTIQARIVRLIAEMQERDDTAVLFITHDLRLAAQVCDDILVLYAGRAAEYGPARRVFATPGHPYTRCLQLANPAMSTRRGLYALPERMPGLRAYRDIAGCAFAPRCPLAIADCSRASPPFAAIGAGHVAACIRATRTPEIAADGRASGRTAGGRLADPRSLRTDQAVHLALTVPPHAFHRRQQCRLRAASERVRRHRRRKRQRQEHAGAADRRTRDAVGGPTHHRRARRSTAAPRPTRIAAATSRWCSRTRSLRSIHAGASPAS